MGCKKCKEKMDIKQQTILNESLNIPEEIRNDVTEVVEGTIGKMKIPYAEWTYFFQVYNRYIAPPNQPEDISCHNCRYKVLSNLRKFVAAWRASDIL